MERRDFFKILSTVSAGLAATSCERKSDTLIPMLVSDREIVPGYEQWHPAVCGECPGACGTIARVMEGERIIERHGEKFRERIACIKKIEGNPLDPVSGGRLCARGQAAVQSLYNPDRVEGPMRRSGARGRGEFKTAGWDEALDATAQALGKVRSSDPAKILFLTGAQAGSRALTIQRFLAALGAPAARTCSLASLALEYKQLSYVSHLVQFAKQEHKAPALVKMNPRGRVPVLKDDDYVCFESLAIRLGLAPEELVTKRCVLRANVAASPVCDTAGLCGALEQIYRQELALKS